MSLQSFLTKIAQVTRLAEISGTKRESYQVAATFPCMIQPLAIEEVNVVGGVFGKTFKLFCLLDADVKDTDKVTIEGSDYLVKGISIYDFGVNNHKEVILQQVIE